MRNPLPPRIIPVLLLKGDGLVKGINFKNHRYVGDPINAVSIFNELEAHELVFLDVEATARQRPPRIDTVRTIADQCLMPFAVGGGIRTVSEMRTLLAAGAEKVVINTAAIDNPKLISDAASIFGRQSVVVSIDAVKNGGKYVAYAHNATVDTGLDVIEWAVRAAHLGAGEIVITSVDHEGTMKGYDLRLVAAVCAAVSVPVVANGGAGDITDFKKAVDRGASGAAAGSMFVYFGARRAVLINYPSAKELTLKTTAKVSRKMSHLESRLANRGREI